jgi:hypothetical protein
MESTVRYLGIEVDDALEMENKRKFNHKQPGDAVFGVSWFSKADTCYLPVWGRERRICTFHPDLEEQLLRNTD